MHRPLVAALAVVLFVSASGAQQRPQAGMVITKSGRLKGGTYLVPNNSEDPYSAAITIQGDNISVDFKGVTLRGTPPESLPDERQGTAIRVIGNNVTIKNAKIRGYKVGIIAKDAPGIRILDSDLSYNWKQHLKSTIERENEDDWMSFHQNEKDEWLRYGAAIYLNGCDGFEVKDNTVTGSQCALMLTRSNNGLAWNNDFSFNSGVGIGLYRSSNNRIMHNAVDWCVRGYSHGYYNRGQDSAGILVYEQSNRNIFAYNSATHGGDGFFLWAGQTTMDTGQGGCNDNIVYGNDFSHAPANGIEATFSRNTFANNYIQECWHGVWGGYSYNSSIIGNWFADNQEGIAIEHGQDNAIRGNYFVRDVKPVRLWQNATQDPNWGYPKNHDTKSRDYTIEGNILSRPNVAFDIKDTSGVKVNNNRLQFAEQVLLLQGNNPGFQFTGNQIGGFQMSGVDEATAKANNFDAKVELGTIPSWDPLARPREYPAELKTMRPEPLKNGKNMFLPEGSLRGRYNIIVDEWGPYDFRFPRLWPEPPQRQTVKEAGRVPTEARTVVQRFRVLGPPGKWRIASSSGVEKVEPQSGDVPGELQVTLPSGKATDVALNLEYIGEHDTFDYLGRRYDANETIKFSYSRFYAPIAWNVSLYAWDETTDPRTKAPAFGKLIAGKPLLTANPERLQFGTSGAFLPKGPSNNFATVAEGDCELPEGKYLLEVTSDDGCRIWIDGKKVIDEWHYQGPTTYRVPISPGKHKIRVEHFEIDGYAALMAEIEKS